MRLFWLIIPLVLVGIVGVPDSFGEFESIPEFQDHEYRIYQYVDENGSYFVPYKITSRTIETIELNLQEAHTSLTIKINPEFDGTLELILPKTLWNTEAYGKDESFLVQLDGREIPYVDEIHSEYRQIKIDFLGTSSKIELTGSCIPTTPVFCTSVVDSKDENSIFYKSLTESSPDQNYRLPLEYGDIFVPYKIENATVKNMSLEESDFASFLIQIESSDDGYFSIDMQKLLPKNVSKIQPSSESIDVFIDGKEIHLQHSETKNKEILSFFFPKETSVIEIVTIQNFPYTMPGGSHLAWSQHELLTYDKLKFSPLQQVKNGILPEDVICRENRVLIFKSADNSPACVKPSTFEKLLERGWAKQ